MAHTNETPAPFEIETARNQIRDLRSQLVCDYDSDGLAPAAHVHMQLALALLDQAGAHAELALLAQTAALSGRRSY